MVTLIQILGWACPAGHPLLTFILLHTDSGVGEDTGVSLQRVVVGAVIILILEGAILTSLLCGDRGHGCEVTRARKALGSSLMCTPTQSRAHRTHHTWLCPALLLTLPFFSSSTIWIWRWQELQFPFRLPVPQVWQRTQSRMLSHTAWKPWAEGWDGQGHPQEQGRTQTLKGRAGEAAPHPRVRARSRSKREITDNKQFMKDL